MAYTTIDDPSAYFQIALYTGNGSTQSIVNDGNSDLQPDWIWLKGRDIVSDNGFVDSSRGNTKVLISNTTAAEVTSNSGSDITSFNTDGFSVGSSHQIDANTNTRLIVTWQWKANAGSTSVNNSGSIQSTVQVNQDAGFSIVTYTGTGSGATVGHGLGAVPTLVIVKNRSTTDNWRVFHQDAYYNGGYGQYQSGLKLNSNAAADHGANSYWNNDAFTTSTFSVGVNTEVNGSGNSMLAYCFTEKQGYSKFGLYTGNGNADGTFVYTGFRPTFVMAKRTNSTGNWMMFDTKRDTFNVMDSYVVAQSNQAEADFPFVDFLSNGFKWRHTSGHANASASTYIYMAFAEHPFVSSTGTPTTAR